MDETLQVGLGNPEMVVLSSPIATGTIEDDDDDAPVAQAWMSRFGRTVATQVVDAVDERLTQGAGRGSRMDLGLQRLYGAVGPVVVRREGVTSEWFDRTAQTYGFELPDRRQVLARSSFQASSDAGAGSPGGWTVWGRGASTHFRGDDSGVSLDGEVVSAIVGFDHRRGRVLAGLALSHSFGDTRFNETPADGRLPRSGIATASVSAMNPYLRVRLNDRISVWSLAGYGHGELGLTESGDGEGLTLAMGALGARGNLLARGGFHLALKTDAFGVRTEWDGLVGGSRLGARASRSRVLIEASRAWGVGGGRLTPRVQTGVRYDGGNAERGAGLEVESGLQYEHSDWGLTVEANGQALVLHAVDAYREWGYGASVRRDPDLSGAGLSFRLNTVQGTASPGAQRLWSPDDAGFRSLGFRTAGIEGAGFGAGRVDTEVGYGVPARWDSILTPYAGWALTHGSSRTYRVGGRLDLGLRFSFQLEADRTGRGDLPPDYRLVLRGSMR